MVKIIRGKKTIIMAYEPGERKVEWKPKFKVFKPEKVERRKQKTNKRCKK
jgi:hypothetical protein